MPDANRHSSLLMKKTSIVLTAAVSGLLLGAATLTSCSKAASTSAPTGNATQAAADKHACKSLNSCQGKGGCRSGNNGCAGKNSCQGKGGCATAAHHSCKTQNACKSQGGCKSGDNGCAGKNSCQGKGGCGVPVKH
jgi:hypothetical protein